MAQVPSNSISEIELYEVTYDGMEENQNQNQFPNANPFGGGMFGQAGFGGSMFGGGPPPELKL